MNPYRAPPACVARFLRFLDDHAGLGYILKEVRAQVLDVFTRLNGLLPKRIKRDVLAQFVQGRGHLGKGGAIDLREDLTPTLIGCDKVQGDLEVRDRSNEVGHPQEP